MSEVTIQQLNRVDQVVDSEMLNQNSGITAQFVGSTLMESVIVKAILKTAMVAGGKVLTILYNALKQLIEDQVDAEPDPSAAPDPA